MTVNGVPQRDGAGQVIGNLLLNIAAVGGGICLVLVFLAVLFNVSLIMFKTGSMSPTIPAGSAALIRQVPASEVEVGDVLTVERAGKLPVTHRVIDIQSGASAGERIIRMKGDVNENEDAEPCARQVFETVWSLIFGYAATGAWSRAWWLASAVAGGRPPALRLGLRRLYQPSM